MNRIFIDLEFSEVEKKYSEIREICKFEIIEFGAVKLNEQNEIIGRFEQYVKPRYGEICSFITELTHITNQMVTNAPGFEKTMDAFLDWIGENETIVYSWSMADFYQLERESRQKGYENQRLKRLLDHWQNFQKQFADIIRVDAQLSLVHALEGAGVSMKGQLHSALSDAENTARLFVMSRNEEQFREQTAAILEHFVPSPPLTNSLGQFLEGEIFQKLPQ